MTTPTIGELSALALSFYFPFTIVEVCMVVTLSRSLLRQYVANVKVHDAGVRALGIWAGRGENRPRAPDQVRILGDDLQPPVVLVRPQRRDDADGGFLNGPVRRVRRSGETKAHASETRDAAAR